MSCQIEQIADCGDISTLARSLFILDREDENWLTQCSISLSPCGNLLAVGHGSRLCLLTSQWINSTKSTTFLITWSGTLPFDITTVTALSICPSQQSSQNGPDWFCIAVGFKNGSVGFYTNTGHLLLNEKIDDNPVLKISCHTGTYGTLPDDINIFCQSCECIISGSSLFQTLRFAKAQLARVQAGLQTDYTVDSKSINIKKLLYCDQELICDSGIIGLELKNTYDHLLAASTYGGYDTWYRSVPPANTLIITAGSKPYIGFHYALEGGTNPPLQDVARAVANKIKSALPGWLGGGAEERERGARAGAAAGLRAGLRDGARRGAGVAVAPDRRRAALTDSLGRVALLDVARGYLVRLFKGHRDAQCAFLQVFEQDSKKPTLSTIKETRRATFLIIYNPKKGLIDIRLMQRGNRVAAFTATKHGRLLYHTCGLVGAEQNYSHKKLNLPEFQCCLLDPDGKLKRFSVPFFFALEGEHSDRSKDLFILRDIRETIKKKFDDSTEMEIVEKIKELKTIDVKKHCLEMVIKNSAMNSRLVIKCLEILWDSDLGSDQTNVAAVKQYFCNLALATLFYRRLRNEDVSDMNDLLEKLPKPVRGEEPADMAPATETDGEFQLLEDDSCILERLLIMAQEKDYKDRQHAKVTFADDVTNTYREFVTCFQLEDNNTEHISIKPDASPEKLSALAACVYKTIMNTDDVSHLTQSIFDSRIDPQDMMRLLVIYFMNIPLRDISLELVRRLGATVRAVGGVGGGGLAYNTASPWWQRVRDLLLDMPCPLKTMIFAMACKAVVKSFEWSAGDEEDAWESVTKENAKWGILIGKLEDISILSIIVMLKESFSGLSLPKLYGVDFDINLKYVYSRGKGSVTELIAKWLCSTGVPPAALRAHSYLDADAPRQEERDDRDKDSPHDDLFLEDHRQAVDDNPALFKWLSLLRRQFPHSASPDYILINMCWEYAIAWQRDTRALRMLEAVRECLDYVQEPQLRRGAAALIWCTYLKDTFETGCRLVNKVGKLPKERLCEQDVGLSEENLIKFLEVSTSYLKKKTEWWNEPFDDNAKTKIYFEKIWDDSSTSLVEIARDTKPMNGDLLGVYYQISCTVYYQCHFNLKVTKPLNSLFDIDYHYVFETLTESQSSKNINLLSSEKVKSPRVKFLSKLVRAAVELITCEQNDGDIPVYNTVDCTLWIDRVVELAELWSIDTDLIRRQQAVALFQLGYDVLVSECVATVRAAGGALLALAEGGARRLRRRLELSAAPAEWIAAVPPNALSYIQAAEAGGCAGPSLSSTAGVLRDVLRRLDDTPDYARERALAQLIIRSCETLIELDL